VSSRLTAGGDTFDRIAAAERTRARRSRRLATARWGATFIGRRLAVSLLSIWIVTLGIFVLVRVLGGDIARTSAGPDASPAQVEAARDRLGLDRSLPEQYGSFVSGIATGDLGESYRTGTPVWEEITTRLPATLKLAVAATVFGSAVGVVLGSIAALRRGTWADSAVSFVGIAGISVPVFWLGLMLISLFAVTFNIFPVAGDDETLSIVLPALTVAVFPIGLTTRMTRASLLDTLGSDYVRTAYSKGTSPRGVIVRHCLRNAALPVITIISLQFGALLGGAVLVESVFAWPGLGRYLVGAVESRDIAVVQGLAVVYAVIFIVLNLIVDILYVAVDPRLREAT
jgi:peptide/nickel transport system permease protein